ncbi:hypothetical protein [Maribellus sediminis]|uniref:hypothetical protein n=1 Tax=Maribellus sediminis TaxID=2696285 RepID=UPI0014314074|nr:hypothetical protein [Maribellus sediminis]
MKSRKLIFTGLLIVFLSGCVVYSFYPLYTESDLFPNDLLSGQWLESDDEDVAPEDVDGIWTFEHPYIDKKKSDERDSLSYILTLKQKEDGEYFESVFDVHLIELGGDYFLDFYLRDFLEGEELTLDNFHVIPVHTFAKLEIKDNGLFINWFDPNWLEELVRQNKIRIHHEDNGDFILLTAKPKELQKFVTKYVNSEDAFKDGLQVELVRNKH